MSTTLAKDDLVGLILHVAEDMIASSEELGELDAKVGDGDLGVTVRLAFASVQDALSDTAGLMISDVLSECAMAIANSAPSTFGTLLATMFLRSGTAMQEKESAGPTEMAEMMHAAAEGVRSRGKAQLGDRTLLDALVPAAHACEEAADDGEGLGVCLAEALAAARHGAERTVDMRARAGRSQWLGDRTVGTVDPGASAVVIMLESAAGFVQREA